MYYYCPMLSTPYNVYRNFLQTIVFNDELIHVIIQVD